VIQSLIRRVPNSRVPRGRIHGRICEHNGVYYKLGKEITKGDMMGSGGSWKQSLSLFPMLLKLTLAYGKRRIWSFLTTNKK
jgi:hypothetical protein